ncbi:RNA-binding riboflavin kinase [Bacillus freudenreichii]|nr:RNA-binding riboflavin kinase [Bacillus freudenreichii]
MAVHNKIEGIVVPGDRLGSKLGFPTINLEMSNKQKKNVRNGVYGVILFFEGYLYIGVMNIGTRPTIKGSTNSQVQAEIHILNFDKVIYGAKVTAYEMFFVRQEQKFSSITELKSQIQNDVSEVITRLKLSNNDRHRHQSMLMHVPDLLFTTIINDCFGVNRGVYNTIDAWFWNNGIAPVGARRQTIIHFLMKNAGPNAKVKLGPGQLRSKLAQYWKEGNVYDKTI